MRDPFPGMRVHKREHRDRNPNTIVSVGQCPFEEQLGGLAVTRLGQVEINCLPMRIHSAEQTHPFTENPNKGFIDVPSG